MAFGITIDNVALDGTPTLYTFPDEVNSVALHANGGTAYVRTASGGDPWTLDSGSKESIDGRGLSLFGLYFSGTGTLELRILTGMNS